MSKYIYGIDIGGTTIKFGLFNYEGKLHEKWEVKTDSSNDGANVLDDIYQEIIKKTPNLDDVLGYGFGVPGPVVDNNIPIVVNLGWTNVNLKNELKELLKNNNIFVGNDANVAALGEAAYGAGKGKNEVAMVTLGTGVGGGLVVNGKLVEGFHGAAGEIGHMNVNPDHLFECNCGNTGCLETVASATGIRNIYHSMKKDYSGESSLFNLKLPSAKAIFDAAKRNDDLAVKVVEKASYYIGYACSVIGIMSNPELIVIGGGVSRAGDFLIDQIKTNFDKLKFAPIKETKICQALLGNDAGIYGAARLVINNG